MFAHFIKTRTLIRDFLTLGILGSIASIVGIAGGLNSMFGGGSSNQATGNYGMGSGASASTGALNQISPQMLQAFSQLMGIDPSQFLQAAQQAGGQYGQLGQMGQQGAQTLQGQAQGAMGAQQNLMGAGNQLWQTAQDPQKALYNQMLQQTQDQSAASSAMRGIGMSPEAAGLQNQATNQFNLGWQNQQLGRQVTGLQGMTGAYQGAGQQGQLANADLAGMMNLGSAGAGATQQGGAVPYQAQQTAYGAPMQYGNQYSTALNTAFNPSLASYNQGQYGTGQANSAAGMQSLLTGLSGMGGNQAGSWLTNLFGGGQGGQGGQQQPYYGGGTAQDASNMYTSGNYGGL